MPFILRKTIAETYLARVEASEDQKAFQFKAGYTTGDDALSGPQTTWKEITFREFHTLVRMTALGLMNLGVRPGDKVAILSHTRIEWSVADMAILGVKGITVPLYPSSTGPDIVRLLNHSEARVVIVDNATQLEKVLTTRAQDPECLPKLEKIIVIDPAAMRLAVNPERNIRDVITFQALRELGRREELRQSRKFEENLASARPEDVFTLCYTTGTTGEPKGVPLTHQNLMSVIEDCVRRMDKRIRSDREVMLAFLPFSHVLGRLQSMIFYTVGGKLAFAERPDTLPRDLVETRPTFLFTVPRTFEKTYSQIQDALDTENIVSRKLFEWALGVGRRYHEAFWQKKTPSLKTATEYTLAKKLVFSHITERFGGRLRYAICGGAPLPQELGEFFEVAGIRILEGYGLTETCAPVTLNDPDHPRFGTVGKPLGDVSIRIAEDGEILIRSHKVFQGYYKNPDETGQILRDGWLYTGDIGFIDPEGYLHITDRKKDIIITSTGKSVAPQKIENLAKAEPLIHEMVVYGDQRPYLTALITLNHEAVIRFANEHQILFSEYAGLIRNSKVLLWVERLLDEVNHQLASYERIRKFMILPHDFTIEGGELTSSLKVRRKIIYERYRQELESLY